MRTINVHLSIGFPVACKDAKIEVEDDATEEDIWREVMEWANEHIEVSWRPAGE